MKEDGEIVENTGFYRVTQEEKIDKREKIEKIEQVVPKAIISKETENNNINPLVTTKNNTENLSDKIGNGVGVEKFQENSMVDNKEKIDDKEIKDPKETIKK